MMDDKYFQEIYDAVADFLPKTWERLVIYLEYGEGSYCFSFYCKVENHYIKCYDLPDVSFEGLMDAFDKIDEVVSAEHEKGMWSSLTIAVTPDMRMTAEFDYTDLTDEATDFKSQWKKKYLI